MVIPVEKMTPTPRNHWLRVEGVGPRGLPGMDLIINRPQKRGFTMMILLGQAT